MIQYLSTCTNRLKSLKNGMTKNSVLWQNQTETPDLVQQKIDELTAKEREIEDLKEQIAVKQSEAHTLSNATERYADSIEALAVGLEKNIAEKLNEYGIKLRKPITRKPAPTKTLIPTLEDDSDGVGFVVSTQVDPDADIYEWQKGAAPDASKTDTVPEMKLFKTTTKTFFVDDDVPKGVRIFYRVRAINSVGQGAWSTAVSKVQ